MIVFSAELKEARTFSIRKRLRVRISVRVKRPIWDGYKCFREVKESGQMLCRERWSSGPVLSSRAY